MDWTEIISMILQGVIVPLIIWGITVLQKYLADKIKIDEINSILDQATDAAVKAVGLVAQTFVDDLKAQGEFTPEKAVQAFEAAKMIARNILSIEGYNLLQRVTSDAEAYIEAAIEKAVRDGNNVKELCE